MISLVATSMQVNLREPSVKRLPGSWGLKRELRLEVALLMHMLDG